MLGGTLDRHQQGQQAGAVLRAGIFLQGLPELEMLSLCGGREPGGVGREKRERGFLVLSVLCEVEMDAANEVPGPVAAFEELLDGDCGLRKLRIERAIEAPP